MNPGNLTHQQIIQALLDGKALQVTDEDNNLIRIQQWCPGDYECLTGYPIHSEDVNQQSTQYRGIQDGFEWVADELDINLLMHLQSIDDPCLIYSIVERVDSNNSLTTGAILDALNQGKPVMFEAGYESDGEPIDCIAALQDGMLVSYICTDGEWMIDPEPSLQDAYDNADVIRISEVDPRQVL